MGPKEWAQLHTDQRERRLQLSTRNLQPKPPLAAGCQGWGRAGPSRGPLCPNPQRLAYTGGGLRASLGLPSISKNEQRKTNHHKPL